MRGKWYRNVVTSIVWMLESNARALLALLPANTTVASTAREFLNAPRDAKTISFLDSSTLANLDRLAMDLGAHTDEGPPIEWRKLLAAVSVGPVIAICADPLPTAIGQLPSRPWLSHVMDEVMLSHPMAKEHLACVMSTITAAGPPRLVDWLGRTGEGRRIRLTHASKRAERLERMSDFFDTKGVAATTILRLRDAAEELLTNAFYSAPVAADPTLEQIPRTQDVALPDEFACDMVYGCRQDLAIVRVRDPFGSLSRQRLLDALGHGSRARSSSERAATGTDTGRGLWRVFSAGWVVGVSVVNDRHTEVLVGIGNEDPLKPHPYAFHLFFKGGAKRRFWKLMDEDTGKPSSQTGSVTVSVVLDPAAQSREPGTTPNQS
jgi:hypothetical protein